MENESYFTKLIHYIHANPVHHGFVTEISDWTWSSYHAMISEKNTQLKREEVLKWFGGSTGFDSLHKQPIDSKLRLEMDF